MREVEKKRHAIDSVIGSHAAHWPCYADWDTEKCAVKITSQILQSRAPLKPVLHKALHVNMTENVHMCRKW